MNGLVVYALSHPTTGEVRYIGKSESGLKRPRQHGYLSHLKRQAHLPSVRWIKKLREQGLDYVIEVVEEFLDRPSLMEGEKFYISYFRSLGFRLLNICEGGEGRTGPLSAESIAKMKASRATPEYKRKASDIMKELWKNPDFVKRIKEGVRIKHSSPGYHSFWLGRKHAPETIKRMSEEGKLRPMTEVRANSIKKMIASNVGRKQPPRSPEWCAKLGREWTEEERLASSRSCVERCQDPEIRARLSQQAQQMWNDPVYREKMMNIRKEQVTEESRKKTSERMRKHFSDIETRKAEVARHGGRPILDQHGLQYIGISAAAKELGLERVNIRKVLRGERKHTGGYVFKYVE